MNVERGHVVSLHYELTDPSGTPIGSTREGEPAAILYGHGGVLPGIERALAGRPAGDRFQPRAPARGGVRASSPGSGAPRVEEARLRREASFAG